MAAIGAWLHFAWAAAALVATVMALDCRVRLQPAGAEAAFWASSTTASLLRAYDMAAGASIVVTQTSLHRKFVRAWLDKVADTCYPDRWSYLVDMVAFHWHMRLFLACAILQIVAVAAAPALYSRWRHRWVAANRVARIVITYVFSVSCSERTLAWQLLSEALLATPSPAMAWLLAYSGASLGVLHAFNMFMPLRWSAGYSYFLLMGSVLMQMPLVASELLRPAVLPSYLRLCAPVPRLLGDLTGMYLTEGEAEAWCTAHPRVVVVVCQVVVGAVVPLALIAAVEGAAKRMYVQQRQRQAAQQQAAAGQQGAQLRHGTEEAAALGAESGAGGGGGLSPQHPQAALDRPLADGRGGDVVGGAAGVLVGRPGRPSCTDRLPSWVLTEVCRVAALLLALFMLEDLWQKNN